MSTMLLHFSSPKKNTIDMWLKFLNPKSDPLITKTQFIEKLEKLARGKFTDSKTIISENFAQGLYLMLVARDTTVESGPDLGQIRITKSRKTYSKYDFKCFKWKIIACLWKRRSDT